MEKIRLAFLLVLIVACSTTVKTENATDNFIFPINFKVIETKIPNFIIKNLNENKLDNYSLTVKDVVDIFEIEKLTLEEFENLIEPLNLGQSETIDYVEKVVETLFIKLSDIKKIFTKDLKIPLAKLVKALENFKVSDSFLNYLDDDNNSAAFADARNENVTFNEETFKTFLKKINKTEKDVFDASKAFFVNISSDLNKTHISNLLHKTEINFSFLLTRPANTTIDSLNPLKEKLLEDFKSYQDSLAVATKEYNIITSKRIHSELKAATMIEINLKIKEEDFSVGLENFNTKLTFAQITSINRTGFAVGTEKIFENCTYITLNNNKEEKRIPLINETFDENQLMGHIEDKSDFKIGGPLVCNEELYGIAEEINDTLIRFVNVKLGQSDDDNKDDKSKAASLIFNSFILYILCIVFRII